MVGFREGVCYGYPMKVYSYTTIAHLGEGQDLVQQAGEVGEATVAGVGPAVDGPQHLVRRTVIAETFLIYIFIQIMQFLCYTDEH